MTPKVNTEDLVDAAEVARILGLSHRNTVSSYLKRYSDMPRPVIDLGPKRPRLWVRKAVEGWARATGRVQKAIRR
jgi:glutathione-regulated potassium-efflux system ancillary protein KefG